MEFVFTSAAILDGEAIVRRNLIATAQENGHTVKSAVTKHTSFLVTDNASRQTTKRKAADRFGTKVLSTKEFVSMLGGRLTLSPQDVFVEKVGKESAAIATQIDDGVELL